MLELANRRRTELATVKTMEEYRAYHSQLKAERESGIDVQTFSYGMSLLTTHHRREVDDKLVSVYYEILSREMNTKEFEAAVKVVLSKNVYWQGVIPALIEAVQQQREAEDNVCEAKLQQLWGGL